MELEKYQRECLRTANFTGTSTEIVCNMCLGIAGESGEIVDYLKKVGFHGHIFEKEKLKKRYPNGFSEADSIARVDTK